MRLASARVESATDSAIRYDRDRPDDVHTATPWHRYAQHIKKLRPFLANLSRDLDATSASRVLDYGCAELPYRDFFPHETSYVAADLPGNPRATLDLNADGTVPAPDDEFDAVVSTQVLEHVADPALYLREAHRVLKPGGRLLLSTHGTFIYHPDPEDYWRWTGAGLRKAVTDAGLRVVRFEGMIGLLPMGLQLVQDAIYWHLPRPLRAPFAVLMQALMGLGDRLHGDESRRLNAQVYGLVAEKP
jgi:SAM-dependent methyltransferase